jgi:hypothetical protein
MGRYDKYYSAQEFILDLVGRELVGPIEEDETLDTFPLQSYVSGILWAQRIEGERGQPNDETEPREIDILQMPVVGDGEESPLDNLTDVDDEVNIGAFNNASVRKPSTMGISCILSPYETKVKIVFKYARYIHSEVERAYGSDGKTAIDHLWERKSDTIELDFDLSVNRTAYKPTNQSALDGKSISIIATNRSKGGKRLFTFTATNLIKAQQKDIIQNESALFQCEMLLLSKTPFMPIDQDYVETDIESSILRMQYRDVKNYAQGHGCAAKAIDSTSIKSSFIPIVEVNQMRSLGVTDKELFNLSYLISADKQAIIGKLSAFLESYRAFRDGQKKAAEGIGGYTKAAAQSIDNIDRCIIRIKNGIQVLVDNADAWRAFILCNKAMLEQRISMELKKGKIVKRADYEVKNASWYPFQLFYTIMIVPDIVDNKSNYSDSVDLLYFPTGGGKTEAYLAVSAFIIFYERITKPKSDHGVTILMRYTLRLLTIQQFERAAALICACEQIRKVERLGNNEISIGLWIGSDNTPNKIEDAQEILEKIRAGANIVGKSNPVQITVCPHCGRRLDASNYSIRGQEMIINCPNGCFGDRLPIYIVDEEIYIKKPTLVISTVDKFARIVWEEKTSSLFGGANTPPPRLIIQDELHLISGPLGTLTGIYESAIDKLCSVGTAGPKIIASTATVKRSKYQIKNLYNRQVIQFPPNGIDAATSFFAEMATREERPCRTYVGLTEQGGSMLDLFLRVFSAVSLADYFLSFQNTDINVVDHYFTMVGYFNALRELGTSSTTIRERMEANINSLLNTKFKKIADEIGVPKQKFEVKVSKEGEPEKKEERERYLFNFFPPEVFARELRPAELTSRRSALEIKQMLDELNYSLSDEEKRDLVYKYVLASNMFSVGVDIDRLGIMLVYGQPKSNSEYIQSTSRVGRSNPGIVFTALNSFRSRDRSYFENFYDYHNNFYKYVEATSITPFSIRSIEKALHSVFVALVRHTIPGLNDNRGASNFNKNDIVVQEIRDFLLRRVSEIEPIARNFAEKYLDEFIEVWHDNARGGKIVYDKYKEGARANEYYPLLTSADEQDSDAYKTLNSVRNVDSNSNIYVRK